VFSAESEQKFVESLRSRRFSYKLHSITRTGIKLWSAT